ncbi:MAG: disulfide bond formation protein DsbA [Opitutaceae bacterium]
MKITYYLEVTSSWCFWVEPTWAELKRRYAGRAEFGWKIAQMNAADYPASRAQCDWFYRRSGMVMRSPFKLSSGWFEPELIKEGVIVAPNLVAEAARGLGCESDEVRLALAHAGERDGQQTLRMDIALAVAVAAGGGKFSAEKLRTAAESAAVRARVEASTGEFFAHQLSQRPAFIVESGIGDKAVFSGVVRIEPLAATIEAMLADAAAYAAHHAHFGGPPAS